MKTIASGDVPSMFSWSKVASSWEAFRPDSAPKSGGIYVFTNYKDELKETGDPPGSSYGRLDELPDPSNPLVLYVGKASGAGGLRARLRTHKNSTATSGRGQGRAAANLYTALNKFGKKIYVRWTRCLDHENELIYALNPLCNDTKQPASGKLGPEDFAWKQPAASWDAFRGGPSGIPGLYAFTTYRQSPFKTQNACSTIDAAKKLLSTPQSANMALYVGQTDDLERRLQEYADAAKKADPDAQRICNPKLVGLLQKFPKKVFLHWAENFIYEAELNFALNAYFNEKIW